MSLTFKELWDGSSKFRRLFLYNRILRTVNETDLGRAEIFWSDRSPWLDWALCGYEGCSALAIAGQRCQRHKEDAKMLPWKWHKGILYRYMRSTRLPGHRSRGDEYRQFHLHRARLMWGDLPAGYIVHYKDENPFNLRKDNLLIMSKVMRAAVREGVISIPDAVVLDEIMEQYISVRLKQGRPKRQWVYTWQTIAGAAQIKIERARQAASRGNLDPSDLASVVEFCHKIKGVGGGT